MTKTKTFNLRTRKNEEEGHAALQCKKMGYDTRPKSCTVVKVHEKLSALPAQLCMRFTHNLALGFVG